MPTKDFKKMETKKLVALLATASDEDKAAIEAILETRAVRAEASEAAEASERAEAGERAEAAEAAEAASKPSSRRMTDEERHELAEQLKVHVNHLCDVVPFNSTEWVGGYIAAVVEDKRNNNVLYAIKTHDGRRIVKVHNSKLIKIHDEMVVIEKKARGRRRRGESKDGIERIEWTPEEIEENVNKFIGNVGKTVEVEKYRVVGEDGEERAEVAIGRIMAIVVNKQSQRLFYRISVKTPTESNPRATRTVYKVVTSSVIRISEELDQEGLEVNSEYRARREAVLIRANSVPQDKVLQCEEEVKKAEARLEKAAAQLEAKRKRLEEAKAKLEEYLAAHEREGEPGADVETSAGMATDPLA